MIQQKYYKDGLISLFAGMENDISRAQMRNDDRDDKYIIVNKFLIYQSEDEENFSKDCKGCRFYRPYKEISYFYNPNDGGYQYPKSLEVEEKQMPSKEKYETMSDEEKNQLYIDILKSQTIIFARSANLFNRFKNLEFTDGSIMKSEDLFRIKDKSMKNFLVSAYRYNKMVSEEEQIYYGFETVSEEVTNRKGEKYDRYDMVLNASIPGYTRLSLHFNRSTIDIFDEANKDLKEEVYPISEKDRKNRENKLKAGKKVPPFAKYTSEAIAKKMPYRFDNHYVKNLGLLVSDDFNGAVEYSGQLRKYILKDNKINEEGIDRFIEFMHPDLNQREIMYLAERAGLGKAVLKKLVEKTNDRVKNPENIKEKRIKYVKEQLKNIKNEEEKKEYILGLGEDYFAASYIHTEEIQTYTEDGEPVFKNTEKTIDNILGEFKEILKEVDEKIVDGDSLLLKRILPELIENSNDENFISEVVGKVRDEIMPNISEDELDSAFLSKIVKVLHEKSPSDGYYVSELFIKDGNSLDKENLSKLLLYSDKKQRQLIRGILQYSLVQKIIDQEEISNIINSICIGINKGTDIYEEIKGIADKIDSIELENAEAIEQELLEIYLDEK